jgi:hypothetical protein
LKTLLLNRKRELIDFNFTTQFLTRIAMSRK